MLDWENKEEIKNAIMNLGSENAHKVDGLLVRIKYLEDSDDIPPAELVKAQSSFLKTLEDMVKEDNVNYEMDLINSTRLNKSPLLFPDPKFKIKKFYRPFLIDQESGCRMVQYEVTRIERPNVKGYGMTEKDAIYNLICDVQPL